MNLTRELKKFAKKKGDFRDFLARDNASPFAFFGPEFAREHDIDGHKIRGVIVNATHGVETINDFYAQSESQNNNGLGVMRSQIIFYCKKSDISGLKRDLSLRLDGHLYVIKDFHELNNNIWRILLDENE